jgi:hypothetical protein
MHLQVGAKRQRAGESIVMIRALLYIVLCLGLSACSGCGYYECVKHQDIAVVGIGRSLSEGPSYIDSIAMKVNDSITGCNAAFKNQVMVGSGTHRVQFPINVRFQLFSQGDSSKELFFEMSENTWITVYTGLDCSNSDGDIPYFHYSVNKAKERNSFVDSSSTDGHCWLIEKADQHCIEDPLSKNNDPCGMYPY